MYTLTSRHARALEEAISGVNIQAQRVLLDLFWNVFGFFGLILGLAMLLDNYSPSPSVPLLINGYTLSFAAITGFCLLEYLFLVGFVGQKSRPYLVKWPVRTAMDVTVLFLALTIRCLHFEEKLLEDILFLLGSFTLYIHACFQLRYLLCNMGFCDMILHICIQNLLCIRTDRLYVYLVLLLFFAISIWVRYYFYSASKCQFPHDRWPLLSDDSHQTPDYRTIPRQSDRASENSRAIP